jgi:hypothetical protein
LGEPEHPAFVAEEALALWRGRALVDLEDWEAGRVEANRLEQMRLDAEELRVNAALRAGRYRDVLTEAQALVARAPLRERRWGCWPSRSTRPVARPSLVGDVYTWDTRPAHWVEFACQMVGRNFTNDEWNAVFEERPYRKTCPAN